jgi:hypothetical protein
VGDFPSPTILVDGIDVMTDAQGRRPMQACRLMCRPRHGCWPHCAADLHRPLRGCGVTADSYPPPLAVGVTSTRIHDLSPAARVLHKAILRRIAATGRAPDRAALADEIPNGHDLGALLRELHDRDVVRLDEHGQVRAAYPFSTAPTAHMVAIDGGPTVFAMCAVDALGIADMLSTDLTITSTDPTSGDEITVAIHGGQATWRPETTVVVTGADTTAEAAGGNCCPPDGAGPGCAVPAVDRCCGVMNFFTGTDTADAWLTAHPHVSGVVLPKEQALRFGVDIFGHLLDD